MSPWRETMLGDELELVYGKALPEKIRKPGAVAVYGSNGIVGSHSEKLVEGPGIIVGRKGSVGEVAFSEGPYWAIDTTYYVKPMRDFNWRYLYYLLLSLKAAFKNTHSTVPGLNRETVYAVTCTIAPRDEQNMIAAILWKIQQAIEVETNLIRVTRELKAVVMKKLFTEGLNGEPQKETELGAIPESWDLREMHELRDFLQYGTSEKCHLGGHGVPVLRIPNIIGGEINLSEIKNLEASPKSIESYSLAPGDVLFVRTNGQRAFVGRCAVYNGKPVSALFASYLIRARIKSQLVNPEFLQLFTETESGRAQLSGRAHGAADGKFNINTKTIDSVLVPLPSLKEQHSIVAILESLKAASYVHENKLLSLQELFKTTLSLLMSGTLRVSHLQIDNSSSEAQGVAA
jgi:type I restriction enzyme S subunit